MIVRTQVDTYYRYITPTDTTYIGHAEYSRTEVQSDCLVECIQHGAMGCSEGYNGRESYRNLEQQVIQAVKPSLDKYQFDKTDMIITCYFTANGKVAAISFSAKAKIRDQDFINLRTAILKQVQIPPLRRSIWEEECGITDTTYIGAVVIITRFYQ